MAQRSSAQLPHCRELLIDLEKPIFDPDLPADADRKESAERRGSARSERREFLFRRHAEGLDGFHRALRAEFAADERAGRQAVEEVYRAGTPDRTQTDQAGHQSSPGRYARELGLAIRDLQQALPYAPDSQKKVINDLIRYYQTGERADWIACGIDWVQDKSNPDFSNGFVEVYKDPRGPEGRHSGIRDRRGRKNESDDDRLRRERRLLRAARAVGRQVQEPESQAAHRECHRNS